MLLPLGLALILLGGVAAFALGRRPDTAERIFGVCVVLGCLVAALPAIALFLAAGGAPRPVLVRSLLATGDAGAFGLDPLSAWFLLIVLGVGGAVTVYGVTYLGRERAHRPPGLAHLGLALLIVALAAVVTARSILAFLVAWEIMAISAYLLVIFEYDRPGVRSAGLIYLVLTHVGTLALIAMFAAWSGGNVGRSFADLAPASALGAKRAGLVLTLALVGFGIKAGAVPGHFWLPGAHAAAPSHISALLSGVMLKTGIYGLFRALILLGDPPAWWGWAVLLLGVASAVLGVLWALAQHDLKRLLAYHSVENIGIILMGLGVGALGATHHLPAVALLGYAGALLHTLNHALFKSLLFLSAGVVVQATGTREIDRLGGLARRMPGTALAFLVGAAAIVGLPPFNGFVSEWLIFMGLVHAGRVGEGLQAAAALTAGLALTGALALACFSKLFGAVFLGVARDDSLATPLRPEAGLVMPQYYLAALCLAIGLLPLPAIAAAVRAAGLLLPGAPALPAGTIPPEVAAAARIVSLLALGLVVLVGLAWAARRLAPGGNLRGTAPTWGCAYAAPTSRMQYSASSYAAPLLAAFGPISGSRSVRRGAGFRTHATDLVLDALGARVWQRIGGAAARLRLLQSGGLRRYLIYVILSVLGLLLYLRSGVAP